jgi:hypothetical protein
MLERTWLPHLQVRTGSLLFYSIPDVPFYHPPPAGGKRYTGTVTPSTAKRIRRTVDILLQKSPKKIVYNPITLKTQELRLSFITLTISDRELINHREAYEKGLSPFLLWLRRKGIKDYIWKAELQDRGQIHYHITTNQFLRYDQIKDEWNRLQRKAGWLEGFKARQGHYHPNSTDIHAVGKIDRLDLYLAKYLSKGNKGATINGKVWGCSKSLEGAKYFTVMADWAEIERLEAAAAAGNIEKRQLERCNIYQVKEPEKWLSPTKRAAYNAWRG